MSTTPIHAQRVAEVFSSLETAPQGLSTSEALARLSLYGPNLISEAPPPPFARRLLPHLVHVMALLLWVAGGVALVGGRPLVGLLIWVVVLVNAGFSLWQEYRAQRAVSALRKVLPAFARVLRDGRECEIASSEVVPGDVLVLAEGDNIPADARVIEEYGLRTNHATLTGDAVPLRRTAEASLVEGISEVERPNLLFAGTSVASGTGRAVVFATGMLSQFGRIAHLTQEVHEGPSPLQREMRRITRVISVIALGVGTLVFFSGIFYLRWPVAEAFIFGVGIIVAAIPEGLLPTVTLTLAMAVQRLARRGVIVKKLAMVETLAKVSVICSDKSGTLTQNQMTVREVWCGGRMRSLSGVGYEPVGEFHPAADSDGARQDLTDLLTAGLVCNNARLIAPTPEHPRWASLGDQTEAALRVAAAKGGLNEAQVTGAMPRVHEIPFDARRKRMTTIHRGPEGEVAFVKGAPREVLALCTGIQIDGREQPLDDTRRREVLEANDGFARHTLRVLALARRRLAPRSAPYLAERVEGELVLLGLVAMMDPPRPEAEAAVRRCREAGIRLVMVTGDYGLTAESFARRLGMVTGDRPRIITGADFETMSDASLQAAIAEEALFARMAPEHKVRLVAAFQARGDVVALTGDGVNDVPALRKADVGIVMGLSGTDVAKEAADVVLARDNIYDGVLAIEEGRGVFENLRKFITYIFASNVPQILPFILSATFGVPLALSILQILAIDLGTDLLPALALGTERPEPELMRRPPRARQQPLIDGALLGRAFLWLGGIETALAYAGFLTVLAVAGSGGTPLERLMHGLLPGAELEGGLRLLAPAQDITAYALAVTVFYAGVVMAQVGNAYACRTERGQVRQIGWLGNPLLLVGILVEIGLLLVLVYVKPIAALFGHVPIPPLYWIGLSFYPLVLYLLDWARRYLVRLVGRLREVRQGADSS